MWYDLKNYSGVYQINEEGQVKSVNRTVVYNDGRIRQFPGKLLQPNQGTNGYLYVNLSVSGTHKTQYIHRLMAETFLGEPDGNKEVDHINENKLDNRLSNLRWIDRHTNASRSTKGRHKDNSMGKNPKAKRIICTTTGESFGCIKEFANKYGINYSTIRAKIREGVREFNGYGIDFIS